VAITPEMALPSGSWKRLGRATTDADGRQRDLTNGRELADGTHGLKFDTAPYFARVGEATFFPEVAVVFAVGYVDEHVHVPLLLSPYGYSTYRGS
jgi:5-hydroxyisourate hydrolase